MTIIEIGKVLYNLYVFYIFNNNKVFDFENILTIYSDKSFINKNIYNILNTYEFIYNIR